MEAYVWKKTIDFPAKVYVGFEKILPSSVKNRGDFTPISRATEFPMAIPFNNSQQGSFNSVFSRQQGASNVASVHGNPFNNRNNDIESQPPEKINVGGESVAIGGSSHPMSYKDMWKMKESGEENKQREEEKEEYEIEPESFGGYEQKTKKNKNKNENTSAYQNLHEESMETNEATGEKKDHSPDDLLS